MTHHDDVIAALSAVLPSDQLVIDQERMAAYLMDRANDMGAQAPIAVVRPESTEHVQAAVRVAAEHGVPVTTRGAGSGLSGGATAQAGTILISTERLRALSIDTATRTAVVGPGLFNAEVKAAAASHGLWYPPDPSSFEFCSIGGNLATNAGGLCCVKYGVTTDYVLGLEVVLADGTAVRLGGPRLKDVAGLSLTKLFVGSEGTLGVITEATLRLLPATGGAQIAVAFFPRIDDATRAVSAICAAGRPSLVELMDQATIRAVDDYLSMGLNTEAEALLLIGSDAPGSAGQAELAVFEALLSEHGADEVFVADDVETAELFLTARRAALVAMEQKGSLLLEDVGVPLPQLGDLIRGITAIAETHGIEIAVVAHAGDGNTHPVIVYDAADPVQTEHATIAFGEVMALAIELGGTITGEHGVGRMKAPFLRDYLGDDAFELNLRIKNALDPQGIFNPGVMLSR